MFRKAFTYLLSALFTFESSLTSLSKVIIVKAVGTLHDYINEKSKNIITKINTETLVTHLLNVTLF